MPRRIRSLSLQDSGGLPADKFFDRVIKYIPADVVGGWVAASGIIVSLKESDSKPTVLWIAFVVAVLLTAAWTHVQTREPGKRPAIVQILVSTAAFVVWAFALGGPFTGLPWYEQAYGSLALIGFTLGVGLVVPPES